MVDLPKDGRTYRIWSVVEDIVLQRYDQIKDEMMRDSYYLLREWLEERRDRGEILDKEFDYFADNYGYYRDDFWPRMEKNHQIRRPDTKPPTVVIERGEEYTEAHLPEAWGRARGFIFVEKSGMASNLELLSHHGWLIVAAQGESTRTFREFAAQDKTERPVLAITDADWYGGGIVDSLKGFSERTSHLGLWKQLQERVTEIGLTTKDAEKLDLPKERDPTRSPDEWRTELNALVVLKERHGIENPLLLYVIGKMKEEEIPLCPKPFDDPEWHIKYGIKSYLRDLLDDFLDEIVDNVTGDIENFETDLPHEPEGEGDHVEIVRDLTDSGSEEELDLEPLKEPLTEIAEEDLDRLFWRRRTAYEKKKVIQEAGQDDVEKIMKMLEMEV